MGGWRLARALGPSSRMGARATGSRVRHIASGTERACRRLRRGCNPMNTTNIDALYSGFRERAVALAPNAVGAADALGAEIAASELPETTFKSLAAAMGKASGLDPDAIKRGITKARSTGSRDRGVS